MTYSNAKFGKPLNVTRTEDDKLKFSTPNFMGSSLNFSISILGRYLSYTYYHPSTYDGRHTKTVSSKDVLDLIDDYIKRNNPA